MSEKPTIEKLEQRVKELEREVSRRKKAEEKLLETEVWLANTQKLTRTGSWVWNIQTGGVEWSEEVYRIFGLNPNSFKPEIDSIMSRFHPDDRKLHENLMQQVRESTRPYSFEARVLLPDSSVRCLISTSEGKFDDNGNLTQISGMVRDITESKQAEESLRMSEAKYRELVQHANSIILRFNTQGRITFFNEFAQSFFGYTEAEIFHQNVIGTIVPPTESSGRDLKAMIEDIIRDPSGYVRNENENTRRDGERRWIAWTNKAILDIDGNVAEILAVGMDITDRKRVEDELRESEERFKLFMRNSPAVTFIKDIDGKYVYFSKRYFDIWGEQAQGWINKTDEELWSPEFAKQYQQNDALALTQGEPIEMIETWQTPGGATEWRTYKFPVKDTSGKVLFLAGMAVDITEQRQLEAQFKQAHKLEAIGALAGGIAHDFNNILSAVMGYTELALTDADIGTPLYSNLKGVLQAGERAKDLVNQILAFSRQTDLERKPVQLKFIVKEALKFLRASMPTTIEIHQDIQSDSLVMADATQIHQVLMNLCTNAGHAMREKSGVLGIKLVDVELDADFTADHPELNPGPYLELTVSDTGHGIPGKVLDRIFDPFFTTKEKGEGTGMGLAVVHGLVGSFGGTILVSSEPGQGSTFKVYLPIIERHPESHVAAEEPIPAGTEHILFVDDEPALVNIGQQILESLGYEVTTRTSSIEALELLKAKPDRFDLVITDMTMPKMAGDELARELMHIRPEKPVILCTGYSARINQRLAMAMGIRAFISKPVLKKEIAETIRRILDEG